MKVDIEAVKGMVLENLEAYATETVKKDLLSWFATKALPAGREIGEAYTNKLKEQAATESGWNKARDSVLLPFLIELTLWGLGKALDAARAL